MEGEFVLYTLRGLAKKEKVTYGYLRVMLSRLRSNEKPLEWRSYKFLSGKDNFIVAIDKAIEANLED